MPESLDATLRRLKEERAEADRRYNDALTALDRAAKTAPVLPARPAEYDEQLITALNDTWNILPSPPAGAGLTGRLTGFIWRTIGPFLERQLTFNSRLVQHLNRNVAAHREAHRSAVALIDLLREQLAQQAENHSRLMFYLQQITPYVDTKDRDTAGRSLVLNASLSALAENMSKRWESMASREQRYEARASALDAAHADLRAAIGVSQQAALTVKRELEQMQRDARDPSGVRAVAVADAAGEALETKSGPASMTHANAAPDDAFTGRLDAYKYVGFEDQFRGSREAIRARLESYVPSFEGRSNVLDVGCGRGEFLDLLTSKGIRGRGIDLNPEMVEVCRSRGLDVAHADAVGYLASLEDASLGGLFAAQVVEHLEPAYLLRFLELAFHKLEPGGRLVLETLNPACWVAFFESFIRDITHVWPLHPETLKYLVMASGFPTASIEYRSPVPPQDRLQAVSLPRGADLQTADLIEAFNANVEKLNARMFTNLDYAITAQR